MVVVLKGRKRTLNGIQAKRQSQETWTVCFRLWRTNCLVEIENPTVTAQYMGMSNRFFYLHVEWKRGRIGEALGQIVNTGKGGDPKTKKTRCDPQKILNLGKRLQGQLTGLTIRESSTESYTWMSIKTAVVGGRATDMDVWGGELRFVEKYKLYPVSRLLRGRNAEAGGSWGQKSPFEFKRAGISKEIQRKTRGRFYEYDTLRREATRCEMAAAMRVPGI